MSKAEYFSRTDRNVSMSIPNAARLVFGASGGATDNVTEDFSKEQKIVEVTFLDAPTSTEEVYFLAVPYDTTLAGSGVTSTNFNFKVNAVIVRDWITLPKGWKLVAISTDAGGVNVKCRETVTR